MAAAASDKARFYMEQSVPELQEYARKGIFTTAEITAIARKRSEFEHLINMPGAATPSDFARYAAYEMNLDALRKRRSKRIGAKTTTFTGQKKTFFVLERGVRKFQGDMGLWMQYLTYCRDEAANKKLAKALTQCLRLHPLKWEIWVWAAQYYVERQADMTTARSYMQRGLRFCKNERKLWLEYAKLEMIYVAKIAARRHILGLDVARQTKTLVESNDNDADEIALPEITAEDINPELKKETDAVDEAALQTLASTPALSGAIPRTIFDTALKHFNNDTVLAESFFGVFAAFADVPCTQTLLRHIVDSLEHSLPEKQKMGVSFYACSARLELFGVEASSPEFPVKLGSSLATLKRARDALPNRASEVAERCILILLPYTRMREELDDGIVKVLDLSITQNLRILEKQVVAGKGHDRKPAMVALTQKLESEGKKEELKLLLQFQHGTEANGQALTLSAETQT